MTLKGATYYTVICDLCGADASERSEYSAWIDEGQAEDLATDADWWVEGGNHICEDCVPRPDFEDAEADGELLPQHGAEGHQCYADRPVYLTGLQALATDRLQRDIASYRARAENPQPWEDPKDMAFQAGIRAEILTARGVS